MGGTHANLHLGILVHWKCSISTLEAGELQGYNSNAKGWTLGCGPGTLWLEPKMSDEGAKLDNAAKAVFGPDKEKDKEPPNPVVVPQPKVVVEKESNNSGAGGLRCLFSPHT